MKQFILGIDIGTTSVKAVLISSDGEIIAESSRAHDLISLHTNWAEEDARQWWENVINAVADIRKQRPLEMSSLRGIGCSGMVPAIVLLDREGVPVRNTIQQNDARAVEQIESISSILDQDRLFKRTGGKTNQQHILPRLLWVQENEPEIWGKVDMIMGSYDYIAYKLTGKASLELNWAVESGAFEIRQKQWIVEDLERFGVTPGMLPPVNDSLQIIGDTLIGLDKRMGIPPGVPVIAGSADHVASILAAGIIREGDLLIKFGGAGDILYCTEKLVTDDRLFFDYHVVPENYLINGCMAASGSLVKWFTKDILRCKDPQVLQQMDEAAEKIPPASEGLILLPYFLGEKTPLFDPSARGTLFGLTLSHSRAHIFRAILEAVCYGFRHHLEVLADMGCKPCNIVATNGGAKSKFWCQIAADVLNSTITAYPSHPGSALGGAFLAGMSVGAFTQWEQIRTFLKMERVFEPNPNAVAVYDHAYSIYRSLYKQLKPLFEALKTMYS